MENMITNKIIRDEIHAILVKLYSMMFEIEIEKIRDVQNNDELLFTKLSFDALNIKSEFQMDPEIRNKYKNNDLQMDNNKFGRKVSKK